MMRPDIGLAFRQGTLYPEAPFHPPAVFPEFMGSYLSKGPLDSTNNVYSMVREALFRHLGSYDAKTRMVDLSALRGIGDIRKVVVKPNWVIQEQMPTRCVTTHASVLRPIIDYLFLAFGPSIEIIVADIPLQSADIDQIWNETGVIQLREHYNVQGLMVRFMDFRRERALIDRSGFISRREPLQGDSLGYVEVCLDGNSLLEEISDNNPVFSVNDYEPGTTSCYHQPGHHRYLIPRTVLAADLFVNVPKLKTHCKAGITAAMKNLIGINGEKGWIPHFRTGAPLDGGDEYPDGNRHALALKTRIRNFLQGRNRWAFHIASDMWMRYKRGWERVSGSFMTSGGAWPGNDTLWRSILDLVRIIEYADKDGRLRETSQRYHLCVIDAVVCGEGEGPLRPSPKAVGMILCSSSPINADIAACQIAGFDWKKIPQLFHTGKLIELSRQYLGDPMSLMVSWNGMDFWTPVRELPVCPLKPPPGWAGRIEVDQFGPRSEVRNQPVAEVHLP